MQGERPRAGAILTGQERLLARSVVGKDGGPRARPDTSYVVTCPACHARFIGIGDRSAEDNLDWHQEVKHVPRSTPAKGQPKTDEGTEMF
jgi:hypothetical protein